MFQIGKTVVSKVIFDQAFCCDLSKCKGACCIEGDAGAPLMPNEVKILRRFSQKFVHTSAQKVYPLLSLKDILLLMRMKNIPLLL